LIDTIQNDMVKSAEDVGWEKQLKDIEKERLPLLRLSTIYETHGRNFGAGCSGNKRCKYFAYRMAAL
jgi:hypothetical protein